MLENKEIIQTLYPELFRSKFFQEEQKKELSLPDFNLFTVQSVEGVCKSLKLPTPPHRSSTHECILLTDGTIMRGVGLDSVVVEKNSVFFLPAGQITTIENVSPNAKGFYCHFDATVLIRKFINLHLINELNFMRAISLPVIHLPNKTVTDLSLLFRRLLEEYHKDTGDNLVQSYLLTILLEIKPHFQTGVTSRISPAVYLTDRFKELIASDFKKNSLISYYADILNVTPNHLTKSVTAVTGKSPSQWINELLILEAKVLLCQSQLSVSQVSYELGIDDPSYFGRIFRKLTGMSPSGFRKNFNVVS